MIQFEELRLRLLESEKPLEELAGALGLDKMNEEIQTLEAQTAETSFWDDVANSNKVLQRIAQLKNKVSAYEKLKTDFEGAVDEYLEYCEENNIEPEKTYKGSLNVRMSPETHRKATVIAHSEHISLNQFIEMSVNEKIETYNLEKKKL